MSRRCLPVHPARSRLPDGQRGLRARGYGGGSPIGNFGKEEGERMGPVLGFEETDQTQVAMVGGI
jgi:hypothetical protein